MAAPTGILSSMGAHKLDVRYGDRNTIPYYNGIIDSALLGTAAEAAIVAGRVMSLTSATKLTPGLGVTTPAGPAIAGGGNVPYFLQNGLDLNTYPDASRSRGMPGFTDKPAAGTYLGGAGGGFPFYGVPLSAGLVGAYATIQWKAAAELSTTEFETASAYPAGTALTAFSTDATAPANRGQILPIDAATDVIVGFAAPAGKFIGPEGYNTLAFTPAYVVGTSAPIA